MSSPRPNILLVTTDQQRTDTLGCYGSAWAGTPHLDALAAGGICCERAYTTNPVCTPARISLFTGLQVSRHGAWERRPQRSEGNADSGPPPRGTRLSHPQYREDALSSLRFTRAINPVEAITRWTGNHPDFLRPLLRLPNRRVGPRPHDLRPARTLWRVGPVTGQRGSFPQL